MEIHWLGRAVYQKTWELQERLRERVLSGGAEALLLCEHDPVLTLGRSARPEHVLGDEATLLRLGIERVRVNRGGQVTYHGPGQLVAYPVIRLRRGALQYVLALGQAVVSVARAVGVQATCNRRDIGVFVGPRKLCAIGVHVSRRIATHGLALNVTRESTVPFRSGLFVPCGQPGGPVTSLAEEQAALPGPEVERVAEVLAASLCQALERPPAPIRRTTTDSLLSRIRSVE